jgi:hypothetical protein
MTDVAAGPQTARLALVAELAAALAFNAVLCDRFVHRAVRLRELLRSGHLKQVEYGGEMTRMIRTLRLINDDLAARFDAFPPLGSAGPASSGVPTEGAPVTDTSTEWEIDGAREHTSPCSPGTSTR